VFETLLIPINQVIDDHPLVVGQQDSAQLSDAGAEHRTLQDAPEGAAEINGSAKVLP